MSLAKIRRAFRTAYREAIPDLPTQFPNRDFTAPADGVWASINVVPAARSVKTLGGRGDDLQSGFTQIDINVPTLTGINQLDHYSDLLVNSFWAGRRLTHEGQVVRIRIAEPSSDRAVEGSAHSVRSVTVYWDSDSQRTGA